MRVFANMPSKLLTLSHILLWPYRFGFRKAFTFYRQLRTFSDVNFDTLYYQREHPYLSGLHPYVHYLECGQFKGAYTTPPKPNEIVNKLGASEVWKGEFSQALAWRGDDIFNRDDIPSIFTPNIEVYTSNISVIMPYYNRKDCVLEAIRSVADQSWKNWTLIIVDDGSVDGGLKAVEKQYQSLIARGQIRIVRIDHAGAATARNTGLSMAKSDWIAYLDTDNVWKPEHLAVHMATLIETGAFWTYSDIEDDKRGAVASGPYSRFRLLQENYIDLNSVVHHRALHESLGGFDVRLKRLIDYDLILRFGRLTPPVKTMQATVRYTVRQDSISSNEDYLCARRRVRLNHICERIGVGLDKPLFLLPQAMAGAGNDLRALGFEVNFFKTLSELETVRLKGRFALAFIDNTYPLDNLVSLGGLPANIALVIFHITIPDDMQASLKLPSVATCLLPLAPTLTLSQGAMCLYRPK